MLKKYLRRVLPDPRKFRDHRLLAWMGASIHHPRLWHISREGIARGIAIGLFFGLLVPIGQIPLAAMFALALHANLPAAVAGTLVTNPFTFAPIYYVAYRCGAFITGSDLGAQPDFDSFDTHASHISERIALWSAKARSVGKPLFVGLSLFAISAATLSYVSVSWLWRVLTLRKWQQRGASRH